MRNHVPKLLLGALAVGTLMAGRQASAATIVNPGFETPALGNGGFSYNTAGATWVFSSTSGITNNNSPFTSLNPNAPQGTQVAFLQNTGSFAQSVAGFQFGHTYTLTFQADQRQGGSNGSGYVNRQNFVVQLDSVTISAFQPVGTAYAPFSTVAFTTTTGTHSLSFVGLDAVGGDNTAFIDNLVLQDVGPAAVPEPGSVAMLVGLGISGSVVAFRRRKRA